VSALVVGADPFRFELPGGISLNPPGDPLFPPDLLGRGRAVEATFESTRPLQRVNLAYVTNGATWSAQYTLLIRGGTAAVSGSASLRSGALTADSAEITLLDGLVNQAASFARQPTQNLRREAFALEDMAVTAAMVQERGSTVSAVGGVHLYEVAGRHSIQPGTTSVVPLFRPAQAPVERVFAIPGVLPPAGSIVGGGGRQTPLVELRYRVRRTLGNPLGALSLPAGVARLYAESPSGRRILIGEASTPHASAGEDLDLLAGTSLDLAARRDDGEAQVAQDSVQRADGGVNIRAVAYLRTYKVTFTNRSDSTETIEVVERRGGGWSVVSSSVALRTARHRRIPVSGRGACPGVRRCFTYRLRVPIN
jgi:hypothetical protein